MKLKKLKNKDNTNIYSDFQNKYSSIKINISNSFVNNLNNINNEWEKIDKSMNSISDTLNKSVHGHYNAKRQIERIIGQWITGKQSGYCFGFEGQSGVGKRLWQKKD